MMKGRILSMSLPALDILQLMLTFTLKKEKIYGETWIK